MKVRRGFVSNSSSSSFLIRTTDSIAEVRQFLENCIKFGNDNGLTDNDSCSYDLFFEEPVDIKCDIDFVEDIKYYLKEYDVNIEDYDIAVNSAGDNSIPYWMWEISRAKYCCRRVHLGY